MKIGVAGLGSMGRRRVRDLLALGHEVLGYDIRADRTTAIVADFAIATVASAEQLLASGLDALVISTPPDRHVEYYARALPAGLPFFSEANILVPAPAWFHARAADPAILGCPSATMRFDPLVALLHERIAALPAEGLRSLHYAAGDFLPRWHPYEPYDEYYAGAARATSAARESVTFELDWICWLLGPVAAVQALHRARGEWRTDIDDTYALLLELESGTVATLTIELHQLAPFKHVRISHREASFTIDLAAGRLERHRLGFDGRVLSDALGPAGVDRQQVYLHEIRAFVELVQSGVPYGKDWLQERHIADVLAAAEHSEQSGRRVRVEEVRGGYEGTDLSAIPPR